MNNKEITIKESASAAVKDFEYDIEQLIENCESITGYKPEVAQGALFGHEGEKMSKKTFEAKVKEFLKRSVK